MPGLDRDALAKCEMVAKEKADKAALAVREELLARIEALEKKLIEQARKPAEKRETR